MTARPLAPADLDAAYAVYAADEMEDAGVLAIEREDLEGDWARPSFDLATDSVGLFEAGALLGAAEVTRGGMHAEGAVLPSARGRGIGSWLAGWTETRAGAQATTVGQNVPAGSTADRFLVGRGYRTGHTAWVLELPDGREVPQRGLPGGYSFATADDDRRVRGAHRVVQEAFGEWEGRSPASFEDWAATTVNRPGTQPWQLRLVEDGAGEVVAVAFTILDSTGCGYVHQLAVDRRHRGRGLAQALLADGFGRARSHGATRSELSTDSRTGALDLYLKVGMAVTQTWIHRVADLPRP
ncbi:MAG TPA: GNAT family N-acetyltransferase [Ornithinibacter sp.]|nr:GNAT family N-acetyltransferase [Ornithinibacter sp.]